MATQKETIRIDLSTTQQQQIKAKTGHDAEAIELTVEELEQRITPRIAINHNETLLVDR